MAITIRMCSPCIKLRTPEELKYFKSQADGTLD